MSATNPPRRLTTSGETSGVVPVPRIHRAMPENERNVTSAIAALARASPASSTQPCLNPACPARQPSDAREAPVASGPGRDGTCAWPKRGRPGYFCSSACREQYEYERGQLGEDIHALEQALEAPGGTYRERRRVETELAMRRWAMQRYLFDAAQVTSTRKTGDEQRVSG